MVSFALGINVPSLVVDSFNHPIELLSVEVSVFEGRDAFVLSMKDGGSLGVVIPHVDPILQTSCALVVISNLLYRYQCR